MKYHLLTGATGLLGSYLLRDCLRGGHRLAVLVRAAKSESGRHRVESILSHWESVLRMSLPRPVVIEGDLTQENLGLDDGDSRWISQHCDSVVHNAASLTFHGNERNAEPWRSNVGGTRRMLELCRTAGIRKFHHVSTAFVCGLREGRVLEGEVDVGQRPGNAYEHSKLEAEKMIHAADWLDRPTIYRPAIIVGDSQTGYTTTFHGFYVMLRLAHTLVSRMKLGSTQGSFLVRGLGLSGDEFKNLVPVDWVSAAFTHIFSHPEHHGRTYHLVTRRPPSVRMIADVIQRAVETYSTLAGEQDDLVYTEEWFLENFREQLEIYHSYWRDDPQFDDSNLAAAVPVACPEMNVGMLMKLAKYAIETNFGRAKSRRAKRDYDIHEHVHDLPGHHRLLLPNLVGNYCLGLDVRGPAGGQWKLMLRDGRLIAVEDGLSTQCSAVLHLDSPTFRALGSRELAPVEALQSGRVVINGNGLEPTQLATILQAAAVNGAGRAVEASL